jgi:hypothetical protein
MLKVPIIIYFLSANINRVETLVIIDNIFLYAAINATHLSFHLKAIFSGKPKNKKSSLIS